jgi:D-alanyl-D-alanine carboxypeptidase (penicillin-binding protein 5/6)
MVRGSFFVRVARAVLVSSLLVAATATPATATPAGARQTLRAAQNAAAPQAFVVVDDATGCVLSASREHEARPPASTAKIMTALTAIERLAPDATIGVSELAAQQPASRIGMQTGQQWQLRDALATLMMVSANDAAYAIAEGTSGSVEAFADAQAATARRLGMEDSTFADPAGLDDASSFRGGPRMSAYDIAIATRNALVVPEIAGWASTREYEFDDPAGAHRSLTNHNKMLPGSSRGYSGATGFKTGYTERAGHTLVGTATRDGRTVIAVVLDTWDTYAWTAELLDEGFATSPAEHCDTKLPDVAVSTYAGREADVRGFVALARGGTALDGVLGPTVPSSTSTVPSPSSAAGTVPVPASQPVAERSATPAANSGGGGGIFTLRNFVLAVLVLLTVLVLLRRRAVRRQRLRRQARRRATDAAMRRGGLPVVDGRYRTGTRVGPPVESHVTVHRVRGDA